MMFVLDNLVRLPFISCSFVPNHLPQRQFGFDAALMKEEVSLPFRKLVRAVAGMTSAEPCSLLSSLPCELMFNDLRDSGKRHMKQEKAAPQNLHCVAMKSVQTRSAGCKTVALTDSDWSEQMNIKTIRKSVFSSLRQSDVQLGISSEGLTRHKSNLWYSKPHILCHRLNLLQLLHDFYHQQTGEEDVKRAKVISAHRLTWISKLVPQGVFFRFKVADEDTPPDDPMLVARSGPYSLLCLQLAKVPEQDSYTLDSWSVPRKETLVLDHSKVEVCLVEPCVAVSSPIFGANVLAWRQNGLWMSLLDYIADFSIVQITASLLGSLCSRLKLPKHSKLDHRHRVELFLRWMGRSQEHIDQILAQIPEKPKRERKHPEDPVVSFGQFCFFKHWYLNHMI